MKIGMYTDDEILEHLTDGEGRGFLGRSMYDAIMEEIERLNKENKLLQDMDKILRNENTNLKLEIERLKEEIKGYEQERERVLNIIEERNEKAIEYIEEDIKSSYFKRYCEDTYEECKKLLEILKGEDNE